jgi:hypothetical protein
MNGISKKEVNIILENLLSVPRIDYHIEEVLTSIAERQPRSIISYFEKRINLERYKEKDDHYKAVPYDFHKLHLTLCKHASVIVPAIFKWFNKKY